MLVELFFILWSLVGGHVVIHDVDGHVPITDLYGSARHAEGATGCEGGAPAIWISRQASLDTLVHELAHAYDCLDNGALDGSPSKRPPARPAWASDYCWESDVEWYACAVVHYRRVDPHTHASWGRDAFARPLASRPAPYPAH
jgi:hypothetical protein